MTDDAESLLKQLRTDPEFAALRDRQEGIRRAIRAGDVLAAKEQASETLAMGLKLGWFTAEGGRRKVAKKMSLEVLDCSFVEDAERGRHFQARLDEERLGRLIDAANKGSSIAHDATCEIIASIIGVGARVPHCLSRFAMDVLNGVRRRPTQGRGWDRVGHAARDWCVYAAVSGLLIGFSRTRNVASDKPCACSIVAEALNELGVNMSEKTIAEITSPKRASTLY